MRVVYVAHSSGLQGAGFALMNMILGVKSKNIEPVLVLPQKGPIVEFAGKLGIRYYICNSFNVIRPNAKGLKNIILYIPRLLRIIFTNYFAKRHLEKVVRVERPDIIHSNTGVIRIGALIAKKYGIPHVWHIREYQTLDFGWTPIGGMDYQRQLYSDSNNRCIAITRDIFNYFGLKEEKDATIYDGVFSKEAKLPQPKKQNYFLYVGCLKKEKGIVDAIAAFVQVADKIDPEIELWLAGDDEINIRNIIRHTSCFSRIKYLGFRRNVYELMANALALIVPSRSEGFGFITVEAMLNHCLVIGRNTGGTKEQFDNGKNLYGKEIGLRFSNVEELAYHIQEVSSGSKSYADICKRAFDTVTSLYTIEGQTDKILAIYNHL